MVTFSTCCESSAPPYKHRSDGVTIKYSSIYLFNLMRVYIYIYLVNKNNIYTLLVYVHLYWYIHWWCSKIILRSGVANLNCVRQAVGMGRDKNQKSLKIVNLFRTVWWGPSAHWKLIFHIPHKDVTFLFYHIYIYTYIIKTAGFILVCVDIFGW